MCKHFDCQRGERHPDSFPFGIRWLVGEPGLRSLVGSIVWIGIPKQSRELFITQWALPTELRGGRQALNYETNQYQGIVIDCLLSRLMGGVWVL